MLCGAPRETALLAAVRGGYTDVVALLLDNGADPNVIACPMDENRSEMLLFDVYFFFSNVLNCSINEEMYGFSNSPLAEATSQKSTDIIALLLRYDKLTTQFFLFETDGFCFYRHGANDEQSSALAIACSNNDDNIIGSLLSKKAHTDPEYKINKNKLDNSLDKHVGKSMSTSTNITYSNIFPTNSVMVNWHFPSCQLSYIK